MNETYAWAAASVIIVVTIISAIYLGVSNSNNHYYEAMNKCITSQGTWVPVGTAGACINNNR